MRKNKFKYIHDPIKNGKMKIMDGLKLSECKDTKYDSSIGRWYIGFNYEPYCETPHFHVVNETLKFDCRIELFNNYYFRDKFHKYELSKDQINEINRWMNSGWWDRLYFYWEKMYRKKSEKPAQPDYSNIIYKEI